jgi:hypothetical protein
LSPGNSCFPNSTPIKGIFIDLGEIMRKKQFRPRYMAVRPEFFSNLELSDLEEAYPNQYIMAIFLGLRSLCNIHDCFPWNIALIKRYLFPKLNINVGKTLSILKKEGFIRKQKDLKGGESYGVMIDPEKLTRLVRYHGSREEETIGCVYWRLSVLERDLFTCQKCGKSGCKLQVHHIKSYKDYPELRTKTDNGITLCIDCHKNCHRKMGGDNGKTGKT